MMKTAMVWGATGGIGGALVKELLADDWGIISISRDGQFKIESNYKSFSADVSKPWEVEKAVFETAMEVGKIDLWIYAAGDIVSKKVGEMKPEDWTTILNANLTGAYNAAHYSLPLLKEGASMVFIGAVSERLRLPGLSAYAAAKAGLEAFVDTLAKEERKKHILLVRPGAVATPFWDKVPLRLPANAPTPEKVAKRILEAVERRHKGQLDLTS